MGSDASPCAPGSSSSSNYGKKWFLGCFLGALLCVCPALKAQTTVNWNTTSSGNWSDATDWDDDSVPNDSGDNLYDVVLPNIDLPGPGTREVTLDTPDVTVNSLQIIQYPWPWPPEAVTPSPPYYNILTLDQNLNVNTTIELTGSRSTLDFNGQTVTAQTIQIDAPVFAYNQYWYRNAIDGDVGTNDGTSEALSSVTSSTDGLPVPTLLGGTFEGGYTVPTPAYVQPSTPVLTGGFADPVPLTGNATTGTIDANLNSQGLVWLNQSPIISGTVSNSSQWGYFRYDGSSGQNITFQNTVTNSDAGAIMDLNGDANENAAVTNENGAYLYNRGAVNLTSDMVNESGGQYLFDPTDSGTFYITGNLTNEGTGTILSPSSGLLTSNVSSYMDFVGNFTMGHDTPGVNVVNEDGAVMVMQGNVLIGQVDQLPKGSLPDIISSLENYTGGTYTFDPTASQTMQITGQIINNGASTPGGYITTMNLLGDTLVRGRTLPSPLVTNINGAVLNYDAYIDIGYDTPNGQPVNQPQGNLDNDNGIINGYGAGNLLFRGGDQENGDATHPNSYINLYDTAQFTTGPQGSNTFDNYGYVNGNSGTPTFNSGIFNNYGTLTANNGSVFTMTSATAGSAAAVNNYGSTIVNTGGTLNTVGGFINYSTFSFNTGGALEGPFIYNDLGGIINATGGVVQSTALANNVGGTMNLGLVGGSPAALVVNSTAVTQAGTVNIQNNFNLVIAKTDFNNAGVVNLYGPNSNITAESQDLYNSGQITGGGSLGLAAGVYSESNQVINSSSTASIAVNSTGMTIGGTEAPINNGTITIASGGPGLSIVGGNDGDTFLTSGTITLGDVHGGGILTDSGTGLSIQNTGTISGSGIIDFVEGIDNQGTITAVGNLLLNNDVTNEALLGTINIGGNSSVQIPDMDNFENAGTIDFQNGNGTLTDTGAGNTFTNQDTGQVIVNGTGNVLSWGNGINNEGTITLNSGSALTYTNSTLTNSGFISLNSAKLSSTQDLDNSDGGTIITTGGSKISTGDFNNSGGSLTMSGSGSNLSTGSFTNNGGAVTLSDVTATTSDFDNTSGQVTITGDESTLSTQDFTNDGGLLSVSSGSVSVNGTLSNGTDSGSSGLIELNHDASLLTSNDVTCSGSIILSGSSTFGTNLNNAAYSDFNLSAGSGSVTVSGASLFDVGDVIQDDGTITVSSGSTGDTGDYTNNGGTLTLNSNSTVDGRPTFNVQGDLTNNSGAVNLLAGATMKLVGTGNLNNSGGSVSLASASTLTVAGTITNTGDITAGGSSAITTTGAVNNNGGSITITSSTLATNGGGGGGYAALSNDGGGVTASSDAFLDVGEVTQTDGTVTIQSGAAGDTLAYSNTGGTIVLNSDSSTVGRPTLNVQGNFTNTGGTLTLLSEATMTASGSFTNSGANAVAALSGESILNVNSLTNTGTLSVEGGSTLQSKVGPDSNAGGTIDVAGDDSELEVNSLNNTGGQLTIENSGEMDNDGVLTNNNNGATLGQILLDSNGFLNTDNNVVTAGNLTVQGGSTMTANDKNMTFTNSGLVVVQSANSLLRTYNLTNNFGATLKANSGGMEVQAAGGALLNFGTIIADPGGIIQTAGAGDSNGGTILVSGTGSSFVTGPNNSSLGNLNNMFGSTLSVTSGGNATMASLSNFATVSVTGTGSLLYVDLPGNSGQSGLLSNNGGNVEVSTGGTINVGSYNGYGNVTADNGGTFLSAGIGNTVDTNDGVVTALNTGSVTFGEGLTNQGGGTLNVTGGGIGANNTVMTMDGEFINSATVAISGGNAFLNLNGMSMPSGIVTVTGLPGSISKINSGGQWTIGAPASIFVGANGKIDPPEVTTNGTITVDPNGSFVADTYIQNAGLTTDDGTMGGAFTINGGDLRGGGSVTGTVDNASGEVQPGGIDVQSNVLTINGGYLQQAASELNIGIAGLGNSDFLLLPTGDATVDGGYVYLDLNPNYVPQIGDTFVVIDAPDAVDMEQMFNVLQSQSYANGQFLGSYTGTTAYVEFEAPVPEPGALAVLGGAWMLLGLRRRPAA
jgi:fibronectin-binding autotransporter adhesin